MLVEISIGGAILLVTAGVAWVIERRMEAAQMNMEIESLRKALKQYAQTYSFEKPDIKLINKTRKYLDKKLNRNYEAEFAAYKTMEEKKRFALEIAQELAKCMNVNVDEVRFDDLGQSTNGVTEVYEDDKLRVVLNEALLVADPMQLVKTTCHELRHCVQIRSLTKNKWGFSSQRIAQWLYSWKNYVCASTETFNAYVSQIIEVDANAFAEAVMDDKN